MENIEKGNTTAATSSFIGELMSRTSVRTYTSQPVSDQQIETLLKAAMDAPSAGNKQPWRFVVIRDKKILEFISDNFPTMTMVRKAPIAVVVCGDLKATFEGEGQDYWIQDTSAASENLLLAAHAQGLGAVWCGVYPLEERIKKFSELLHLPDDIVPLNCIAVGHPAEEHAPKDKWKPEYVHYDSWTKQS